MQEFNIKKGLILTLDQEEEFSIEGKKIIVKPVWKWILEQICKEGMLKHDENP